MTQTAAARYREVAAQKAPTELVDVPAPSGFVFVFEKPSRFGVLFGLGSLPTAIASQAVEAWQEQGVTASSEASVPGNDTAKMIETALRLRDQVLKLSHSPKLVIGVANEDKDEMSTDEVTDEDLAFLLQWVAGGGEASSELVTFPEGPAPDTVAGTNRKGRRAAAKRAS